MNKNNKITMMPVADLVPYANNARTHSEAQIDKLCASIAEFGFVNPVLVDGQGVIIAGHGRVMAAKKSGLTAVPTLLVDHLTEAQKKAYIIADNQLALDAGWDENLLKLELQYLQELDFDLSKLGFAELELDAGIKKDKLQNVDLSAPVMSWVLVGVPLVHFGKIQPMVDAISIIPETIVQTTCTD